MSETVVRRLEFWHDAACAIEARRDWSWLIVALTDGKHKPNRPVGITLDDAEQVVALLQDMIAVGRSTPSPAPASVDERGR